MINDLFPKLRTIPFARFAVSLAVVFGTLIVLDSLGIRWAFPVAVVVGIGVLVVSTERIKQ